MTIRLALRSLLARPVRSAVLACGFGFGISVMAALLGVGEVILEQSRAPALRGGGDLIVSGANSKLTSARFVATAVLGGPGLGERVRSVAPSARATLYLLHDGKATPVYARGGVPSLDRQRGDPEIAQVPAWVDPPSAARWTRTDPGDVVRALDRFHPIPAAPDWEDSWAEWLYFNGGSAERGGRFYLSFLVGPRVAQGMRGAVVRLQLERDGVLRTYSRSAEVDEAALLKGAPDIDIAGSRVRLDGLDYRIDLELDAEVDGRVSAAPRGGGSDVVANLVLRAVPGRAVPPFELHGAGGWVSGYVVPVLSGALSGVIRARGQSPLTLDGTTGYHDHNWGFWRGVAWQWGQTAHGDLSIVYGRVRPPAEAADPERIPGFLAVLGPEGPLGFSTRVTIRESGEAGAAPDHITVEAEGEDFEARLNAEITDSVRSRMGGATTGGPARAFVQMRARFAVEGRVAGRKLDFTAPGSAETFQAW